MDELYAVQEILYDAAEAVYEKEFADLTAEERVVIMQMAGLVLEEQFAEITSQDLHGL